MREPSLSVTSGKETLFVEDGHGIYKEQGGQEKVPKSKGHLGSMSRVSRGTPEADYIH